MNKFILMAQNGTHPPRCRHDNIDSAIREARRLNNALKCEILILEIVGNIKTVDVPIVQPEQRLTLSKEYADDLPF